MNMNVESTRTKSEKLWKLNWPEPHGRDCEEGTGTGGIIVIAGNRKEAIYKLYKHRTTNKVVYYIFEFITQTCPKNEEDVNEIILGLDKMSFKHFRNKLEQLSESPESPFLVQFPETSVIR